jgi:hypothetical protein
VRKEVARHFDASQLVFAADQRSHNRPGRLSTLFGLPVTAFIGIIEPRRPGSF